MYMRDLVKQHSDFIGSPDESNVEKSKEKEVTDSVDEVEVKNEVKGETKGEDDYDKVKDETAPSSGMALPVEGPATGEMEGEEDEGEEGETGETAGAVFSSGTELPVEDWAMRRGRISRILEEYRSWRENEL